ncbi:SRPBCC domain-containing protein [Paenibacillus sp. GCM10027626]|uniref:SRPBCC family protein n=1 Tax=Paenibacillus sp. GCM10027626 TaxID=3273411 RepID=UPI00363564DE
MAGALFKKDIEAETGVSWENWIALLKEDCGRAATNDEIEAYLQEVQKVNDTWIPIIAAMYGQLLGRKPVGQTAAVGFNIGVRRTVPVPRERLWDFLVSPEGMKLWIGDVAPFLLQVGSRFASREGTSGKLGVVKLHEKLRMSWQRHDWDSPSTLQIYLLPAAAGKTTISFHQEKLDDLYMREMMRRHWDEVIIRILAQTNTKEDLR